MFSRAKKQRETTKRGFLMRLKSDVSGNTLMIVGGAIIPLTAMIGSAVDMSRIYMAQTRLQQACDAGALAGRKVAGDQDITNFAASEANEEAQKFFHANYLREQRDDDGKVIASGTYGAVDVDVTYTQNQTTGDIDGSATAVLPMTVTKVIGKDQETIQVDCDARLNLSNTDIMMVLDVTGSMNCPPSTTNSACGNIEQAGAKIKGLRQAAKDFYDVLEPTQNTDAQLRYGFVPYSMNVNVGKTLMDEDPSWIANSWTYQSREYQGAVQTANSWAAGVNTQNGNPATSYPNVSGSQFPGTINTFQSQSVAPSGFSVQPSKSSKNACESTTTTPPPPASSTAWGTTPDQTISVTTDLDGVQTTLYNKRQYYQAYDYAYYWVSTGSGKNKTNLCQLYRRLRYPLVTTPWKTVAQPNGWSTSYPAQTWVYKPVTLNLSNFKSTLSSGVGITTPGQAQYISNRWQPSSNQTSKWTGCVEERNTVAGPIDELAPPEGALDLDINLVPDQDTERWRPSWPEAEYIRSNHYTAQYNWANNQLPAASTGYFACPNKSAQKMQEMDSSTFDTYLDTIVPRGGTYHDIGMLWGGRLISPDGLFASENQETSGGMPISRHLLFMTDGELAPGGDFYSAYGVERMDRRVTNSDTAAGQFDRHEERFLAICNAIRNKLNVTIWVVGFGTTLSPAMYQCAGDDPLNPTAAKHTFSADDSAELSIQFKKIASNIAELRVGQ